MQDEKERKERLAQLTESAKQRVWAESKNLQKDVLLRDEVMRKKEAILNVSFSSVDFYDLLLKTLGKVL